MEFHKKKKFRVGVIENEAEYRSAIINELINHPQIESLIEFSSCEKYWHSRQREDLDILFLDIAMPGLNGLELISMIKKEGIKIKLIILTNLTSEDTIIKAIKQGAIGYLWKSELDNIREVVDIVMAGGAMISPNVALKILKSFQPPESEITPETMLTEREKQVLDILISGAKCDKVADIMKISVNTVRKHIRNIYEKLQVTNRMELIKKATDIGIL